MSPGHGLQLRAVDHTRRPACPRDLHSRGDGDRRVFVNFPFLSLQTGLDLLELLQLSGELSQAGS